MFCWAGRDLAGFSSLERPALHRPCQSFVRWCRQVLLTLLPWAVGRVLVFYYFYCLHCRFVLYFNLLYMILYSCIYINFCKPKELQKGRL